MAKMRVSWVPGSAGTKTSKDIEVATVDTGDGLTVFLDRENRPVLVVPVSRIFDAVLIEDAEDES